MSTGEVPPQYTTDDIQVLSAIEHVRARPVMYIGGTDDQAIQYLVIGCLDMLLEQHLLANLKTAKVSVTSSGVEIWLKNVILPKSEFNHRIEWIGHSRGPVNTDWSGYRSPFPLPCVALSKSFNFQSASLDEQYQIVYRQGRRFDLKSVSTPQIENGIWIRFEIDPEIFGSSRLNLRELRKWLIDQLRTLPELSIEFEDREARTIETLVCSEGGQGYVDDLLRYHGQTNMAYPEVIRLHQLHGDFRIDVAFTHHHSMKRTSLNNFINGDRCSEGGAHLDGFHEGIADALSRFGGKDIAPQQVQTGMIGAVSVVMQQVPDIWTEGPTREKAKLVNAEFRDTGKTIKRLVSEFVSSKLQEYLRYEPELGRAILSHVMARK